MDSSPKNEPPSRRERRRQDTRDRLLTSAVDLFVAQGYQATTVDDIARAADVARATAFNYFPRKEDYLAAFIEARRDAFRDRLTQGRAAGWDTIACLLYAFAGHAALYEADAAKGRPIVREWLRAGGPLMAPAAGSAGVIGDILAQGQRRGDVRADVDAMELGAVILDIFYGALYRWAREEDASDSLAEPLARALRLVLGALRTPVAE